MRTQVTVIRQISVMFPKWKQWLSLIILILTLLGMIFEDRIGIKLCITGCIGALTLIVTGVISEKQAFKVN